MASMRRTLDVSLGGLAGFLTAFAGVGAAAPEYLDDPKLGLAVGGASALLGAITAISIDRWHSTMQDRRAEQDRWNEVFYSAFQSSLSLSDVESPSDLLSPFREIVPFQKNRFRNLSDLRIWLTNPAGGPVYRITGAPGSGKTRLAIQFNHQLLKSGIAFTCGWVRRGREVQALEFAASLDAEILLVVDEADTRQEAAQMMAALASLDQHAGVRVLLIARDFGEWWTILQTRVGTDIMRTIAGTTKLPVADDVTLEECVRSFTLAREAFEKALNVPAGKGAIKDLSMATPMSVIHASALAEVWACALEKDPPANVSAAISWMLESEVSHWVERAESLGLDRYSAVTPDVLKKLLAFCILVGSGPGREPTQIVRSVPELNRASAVLVNGLIAWSRQYTVRSESLLAPLVPSVIQDALIVDSLDSDELFARSVVQLAVESDVVPFVIERAVRASVYIGGGDRAFMNLVSELPFPHLPNAIRVVHFSAPALDRSLAAAIQKIDLSPSDASRLLPLLPARTEALRNTAVAVTRAAATGLRDKVQRTQMLILLSRRCRDAWLADEGVRAAEAALTITQASKVVSHELTATKAAALAEYAANLGISRGRERALESAQESVKLRRQLAADGIIDSVDLAISLATVATLSALRLQFGEALRYANESVNIMRLKAQMQSGGAVAWHLADSLKICSSVMWNLGDSAGAVRMAKEVVREYRVAAEALPDAYTGDLAQALVSLANVTQKTEPEESIEAANEAVKICRLLAQVNPFTYGRELAPTLNSLALALYANRRFGEALYASKECVNLVQAADSEDVGDLMGLGISLDTLANIFAALGKRHDARAAQQKSVAAYERIVAEYGPEYMHDLAAARDKLARLTSADRF